MCVARRSGWALGLILAVAIGTPAVGARAQSGEAPAEGGGPIPLAEVAARAAEIRSLLETQDAAIRPSREIQAILERLPKLADDLRARLDETAARLESNPPLPVIEQLGSVWEATRAKLTILASAFGVGAGLGLQNLVNNFASGLILLFEQPIHLGDVVQIAGIGGEVRHIGARATLVRTADGAEVFVPNSVLIAQAVTNWTYSDLRRRIVLPVRVASGAAPRRVSELLTAIATRHPQVSADPAPAAVFMRFGENSLDFELRAWTDRFGDAEGIQSQLADSVYAGLNEARIELPVPRRDVRLRTVAAPEPGKD